MEPIQTWLSEIRPYIPDFVADHWMGWLGSICAALAGTVATYVIARWAWWRRQFHNTLHVGINTFENAPDGKQKLILDVVFEDMLTKVINDPIARRLIHKAIRRTTLKQPFLMFPKNDCWHVMNLIRLAIAETCKRDTLGKLIGGVTVHSEECVFAVTYERYKNMRSGKIRVLLMKKSELEDPTFFDKEFVFEADHHCDRVTTLKRMQEDWLGKKGCTMDVRLNFAS